jgi:hypothetical protein
MTAKRDRERFERQIFALLEEKGATRTPDQVYDWELPTSLGILRIRAYAHDCCRMGPGNVMCRFDEPKRAKEVVDCNPYSGKWNHHFTQAWTAKEAVATMRRWFDIIIT